MSAVVLDARGAPPVPRSAREVQALLELVAQTVGLQGMDVTLRLVDDCAIARLNAEHLGLTGPTNVLSFPAGDDVWEDAGEGGDVAISVDAVAREAALYGQDPLEHLARLLAHGLLHLAGYPHGPDMDALCDSAVAAVAAAGGM